MDWNNSNQQQQTAYQQPININEVKAKNFIKKHGGHTVLIAVIAILALVLFSESVFIVGEAEQAMVSRFGVIKRIITNTDNDFHDKYAEQLKDEITSSGSVKCKLAAVCTSRFPLSTRWKSIPPACTPTFPTAKW